MATDKIINPFKDQDIAFVELPSEDVRYGSEVLGNLKELQIGSGKYGFYSDESGIWLGSKKFSSAPFSVDMRGKMRATSGLFTGDIQGSVITGSLIVGSTLSTGESYEQHIEIESTLISYYDENGNDIGYSYAENGTYIIKSNGNLHLIGSYGGNLSISLGDDINYVMNDSYFYTPNDADLGTSAHRWGTLFCSGILVSSGNEINASGSDLYIGSITLNGDTIYSWSDIASYL